jgi:hypothetical protein
MSHRPGLEYFQGIMFLMANQLTTFDDAFQSRIHFAMKFGDFTIRATWETSLQKVPREVKISKEEMRHLSHKDINGRQLRRSQLSEGVTATLATDRRHSLDQEHYTDGVGSRLMEKRRLLRSGT